MRYSFRAAAFAVLTLTELWSDGAKADVPTIGVPACDTYIASMTACIENVPVGARDAASKALSEVVAAWRAVTDSPVTKTALQQGCEQALEATKKALGSLCPDVSWEVRDARVPDDPLVAKDEADAEADPNIDHVVVVLDGSGSMAAPMGSVTRMDAAKTALTQVMKDVPATTHVGLVVFSAAQKNNDWVYPLGPLDYGRFVGALQSVIPKDATPLGTYIKVGADALLERRKAQFGYGTYRLLVVTDGEATGTDEAEKVRDFPPDVMSRGITLDVIGVAMNSEHTLATKVHSYRNAADAAGLAKAVSTILAEVSGQGDQGGNAAAMFDDIQGLDGAVASKMLEALTVSGNHPIGTEPAKELPPEVTTNTPVSGPGSASAPSDTPSGRRDPTSVPESKSGAPIGLIALIAGAGAIAIAFIVRKSKKSRR